MTRRAGILLAVLAVLTAGAAWWVSRADAGSDLPVYWSAPDFTLVDQHGETLERSDLHGNVWVASFIFTSCESVCPVISARMADFRDLLRDRNLLGSSVRLVSITVDPARDTPDVLRRYAGRFGDPAPEAWAFLTGGPPESVRTLVQEGFRVTAMLPPDARDDMSETDEYQVSHSPRVVLVDRQSRVRGTYVATERDAFERLLVDLETLME